MESRVCLLRRSVGGVRQCKRWMGLVTGSWERKRFYGHVRVYKSEDGQFGVQLDHRHLRTPLRQLFLVPFEPLALLAAQEWVGQVGVVKPPLMHVTSMCNTVLDNPRQLTSKQSVEDLIVFLESDTLRCQSVEPAALATLQEKQWEPVIKWFNERFSVSVSSYTSLLPPAIPESMLSPVMRFMRELSRWSLTGFEVCVEASKSLILSCALFEGRLNPQQVTDLSRLEVSYQTSQWGEVEWQHGLEDTDLRARLTAGLAMHQLTSN